jgi:hypothetical protein
MRQTKRVVPPNWHATAISIVKHMVKGALDRGSSRMHRRNRFAADQLGG